MWNHFKCLKVFLSVNAQHWSMWLVMVPSSVLKMEALVYSFERSACHLLSRWFLAWLIFRPWRWRRYVPPKRPLTLNRLHGVISQKMVLFKIWTRHFPNTNQKYYHVSLRHHGKEHMLC
jgi:hypothetical protein